MRSASDWLVTGADRTQGGAAGLRRICERTLLFQSDHFEDLDKAGNEAILTSIPGVDQGSRVLDRRAERSDDNSQVSIILGSNRVGRQPRQRMGTPLGHAEGCRGIGASRFRKWDGWTSTVTCDKSANFFNFL